MTGSLSLGGYNLNGVQIIQALNSNGGTLNDENGGAQLTWEADVGLGLPNGANLDDYAGIWSDGSGNVILAAHTLWIGWMQFATAATASQSLGSGAGSGATAAFGAISPTSIGQISVTTGSSPAANSTVVTVRLNQSLQQKGFALISPANGNAAALSGNQQIYLSGTSASGFTIESGSTPLAASTIYVWNYLIVGGKI
jgi:hypothetical protein